MLPPLRAQLRSTQVNGMSCTRKLLEHLTTYTVPTVENQMLHATSRGLVQRRA